MPLQTYNNNKCINVENEEAAKTESTDAQTLELMRVNEYCCGSHNPLGQLGFHCMLFKLANNEPCSVYVCVSV